MPAEKTNAIVLRLIDFSETSCIVTLFTEDFGKVAAMAKGGRRPKGPFEAALDALALCRIVFLSKSSGTLDLLTEAKLIRRFRNSSRRLPHLYAAYYVAELMNDFTHEGDRHVELFELARQTLLELDQPLASAVPRLPLGFVVMQFEWNLLRLLGHMPELANCVECGKRVAMEQGALFALNHGGLVCHPCRGGKRQVVRVSPKGLQALQALAALSTATPNGQIETDVSRFDRVSPAKGEIRGVLTKYITHLLGHRPKMHEYLVDMLA